MAKLKESYSRGLPRYIENRSVTRSISLPPSVLSRLGGAAMPISFAEALASKSTRHLGIKSAPQR
jgi:hypothetical protein